MVPVWLDRDGLQWLMSLAHKLSTFVVNIPSDRHHGRRVNTNTGPGHAWVVGQFEIPGWHHALPVRKSGVSGALTAGGMTQSGFWTAVRESFTTGTQRCSLEFTKESLCPCVSVVKLAALTAARREKDARWCRGRSGAPDSSLNHAPDPREISNRPTTHARSCLLVTEKADKCMECPEDQIPLVTGDNAHASARPLSTRNS